MSLALDADTCIEVLRVRNPLVIARYRSQSPQDIIVPSMVAAELLVGAEKSIRPTAIAEVESFLSQHAIAAFGEPEMRAYARIRALLEKSGQKIGGNDLIIAATALVAGATLVTHNVREFSRVPGLALIDWQTP